MKILITGADGFIGKNLVLALSELACHQITTFTRKNSADELANLVQNAEFIFHLAGVNRPPHDDEFATINTGLSETICRIIENSGRHIPIVLTSSTQAINDNPYGQSKHAAEELLLELHAKTGSSVYIFRLPNVFGKWCRPNYNSVVATFCHNIANSLAITINDRNAPLQLVYIDDVVTKFISLLNDNKSQESGFCELNPVYNLTVGELAEALQQFEQERKDLTIAEVGSGLLRALYATYLSYLPVNEFNYLLSEHRDSRGSFAEILKTTNSGQFSFFTAHPGITRGGHYHHTKNEKFLVVQGAAKFEFFSLLTLERYELIVSGDIPQIVVTIPGWAHSITNIGNNELLVFLWANELFNPAKPDTMAY